MIKLSAGSCPSLSVQVHSMSYCDIQYHTDLDCHTSDAARRNHWIKTHVRRLCLKALALYATSHRLRHRDRLPSRDLLLILMSTLLASKHQSEVMIAEGASACGLRATSSRMVVHASAIAEDSKVLVQKECLCPSSISACMSR